LRLLKFVRGLRAALKRGLITDETARAVEGLSILRNLAAHGRAGEVTPASSRELDRGAASERVCEVRRQPVETVKRR
jgi:hypothetical protein